MNAQDKENMSFGVKGGLNISSISDIDEDGINKDAIIKFYLAFFAEFMIHDQFAVQPVLIYSTQGVIANFDGEKADFKLKYINFQVMAKYYIADAFSLKLCHQIRLFCVC